MVKWVVLQDRPERLTPTMRGSGCYVMLFASFWLSLGPLLSKWHIHTMMKHFYPDGRGLSKGTMPPSIEHEEVNECFDEYENNVNHMLWHLSPDLCPTEHMKTHDILEITLHHHNQNTKWFQMLVESMPRPLKHFWLQAAAQHLTKTLFLQLNWETPLPIFKTFYWIYC